MCLCLFQTAESTADGQRQQVTSLQTELEKAKESSESLQEDVSSLHEKVWILLFVVIFLILCTSMLVLEVVLVVYFGVSTEVMDVKCFRYILCGYGLNVLQ